MPESPSNYPEFIHNLCADYKVHIKIIPHNPLTDGLK